MEEEEDSDHKLLTAIIVAVSCLHKRRRPNYHVRDRIEWDNYVHQLTLEGDETFVRMYRMPYASFKKLCTFIDPEGRRKNCITNKMK